MLTENSESSQCLSSSSSHENISPKTFSTLMPGGKHPLYCDSSLSLKAIYETDRGFPSGSDGKEYTCNEGDPGSSQASGRPPGEGNGNPLQYPCLENPIDGVAWRVTKTDQRCIFTDRFLLVLSKINL